MMSQSQRMGLEWERWTVDQLKARGYGEARLVSNWLASVDIMLETLPIEVKAANPKNHRVGRYWRKRWQFDALRLPSGVDSLVIMIALVDDQPYPFIVPSWLMGFRYNVHLTSHPEKYKGYFARFLNCWEWVDVALAIRARYAGQYLLPLGTGDNPQDNLEWGQNSNLFTIQKGLSPSPLLQGA
jgi:hypothetical protein